MTFRTQPLVCGAVPSVFNEFVMVPHCCFPAFAAGQMPVLRTVVVFVSIQLPSVGTGVIVCVVFVCLTLPTAEAGGILVSSTGCLRVREGLTGSPQAFGLDVSRPTVCSVMFYAADSSWPSILSPSSRRLLAALTSRSWNTPHCGHVHSRTSRFLTSGLRYPQSWQSWLDG